MYTNNVIDVTGMIECVINVGEIEHAALGKQRQLKGLLKGECYIQSSEGSLSFLRLYGLLQRCEGVLHS